ncbi:uncharacterized protein F4817DRAFT_70175 [Daldinia loculata]|uniref:uncharacterized protein n=1 Tax=Daldinia loculata TaxID=103429 RepID=UPI0020C559E1|nr:uncharacterized protein F4817DRAFT_70175 [Daldinia loculata]KAI1648296.1 hypothetical protein F4817DRAFT_70175 [Daldinia loculata]
MNAQKSLTAVLRTPISTSHTPHTPHIYHTPQPPQPPFSTQLDPPDTTTKVHTSLQGRLWNEVYDCLKAEQPKLVDAYETLLSRELIEDLSSTDEAVQNNDIDQTNSERRRSQMHRLVQAGLEKTGTEATVKQNIQGTMNYISPVKEFIDIAVKSVPEAAIAWTVSGF